MKELFLLKLGEIVLKGQNRRVFEDKLKTNTRRRMSKFGQFKVTITQSTLYVEPLNDECDFQDCRGIPRRRAFHTEELQGRVQALR